ncbi:MAG: hypothetical protein K6E18_09750 [Lachnospiraceae bacterium]|nr:hypothetical protein [Lachnospiraceae bacterium]
MSDSYEMIFVVVVFFFIILWVRSSVGKAAKQAERMKKEGEVNKQVGITTSSSFASAAGSAVQKREAFASQAAGRPSSPINYPSAQPGRPAAQGGRQNANTRASQKPAARAQGGAAAGAAADESLSTTEMLAQKAKLDQIEHQKEQMEQRRHEQQYYRNYNYAKRYLLGDPVSPTEKLIYCPNCAAENLIKIHENPKKYNCYFCREKLDG